MLTPIEFADKTLELMKSVPTCSHNDAIKTLLEKINDDSYCSCDESESDEFDEQYKKGWNDCLDEINIDLPFEK